MTGRKLAHWEEHAPPDPSWADRAACRGTPTETFFPTTAADEGFEAKLICAGCPVRDECAEYAEATNAQGIWAGVDRSRRGYREKYLRTARAQSRTRRQRAEAS